MYNINDDVICLSTGSQAVKAKAKPGSKEYHGTTSRYTLYPVLFLTRIVNNFMDFDNVLTVILFDNRCGSYESISESNRAITGKK
jgi:hypothetical protein